MSPKTNKPDKLNEGQKTSYDENTEKLLNVIKIKTSNKLDTRPKPVVRNKTGSRRRGGIPSRQRDNPESILMTEQNNRKYKPAGPRTAAHRRRQKFGPS